MGRLRTLPDALADAARGDAGYLFAAGRADTFRSFADIRIASMRAARALREAGLRRGDLVALVIADAEAFLTMLCAASMAGVIPASLYPPALMGAGDLSRYLQLTAGILRAARARAVVTSAALVPAFDGLRPRCPSLSLVIAHEQCEAPLAEPDVLPALDDIAFVQFTSGSTSAPKGVALTHANLSANIDAINGPAGLMTAADDVGVSWLPLNHDMGLVGMALGAMYAGASLRAAAAADVREAARPSGCGRSTRHRGTVSFAPNFAYDLCVRRVKDADLEGLDLSRWRVAGCGAEPIHRADARGVRATSSRPPGSARPASFRATASPSTCWPRRSRRGPAPDSTTRTTIDRCVRRGAGTRQTGQLRPSNPGHRSGLRRQRSRCRSAGSARFCLAGPVRDAGLLQRGRATA